MIHAWLGRKICSAKGKQEDQDWHLFLRRSSLHLVRKHSDVNPTKGTSTGTSPPWSSPQYVPPRPPARPAVHSSPTDSLSTVRSSAPANVRRQSLLDSSCGCRTLACPLRERSLATRNADPAMATLRSGSCHHDSFVFPQERRFSRPLGMKTRGQFSGTVFRSPIRP